MSVKPLSRRTVLRGLGTAMSLPFLDAMAGRSAFASAASAVGKAAGATGAAAGAIPTRVAWFFIPNGVNMENWTPKKPGAGFDLPATMAPLNNVKDYLTVFSGLTLDNARPKGDGPGDHARSAAAFLTGAKPYKTAGANIKLGVSADQVAATRIIGVGYRAVNLGFGFEAIASATDRQTVLERSFQWLAASGVGVADQGSGRVTSPVAMAPARPNPFNPATLLAFEIAREGTVELRILDASGRMVRTLAQGFLSAGRHEAFWDGRDSEGRGVASGLYVAEVTAAGQGSDRTKLVLVR